MSTDLTAVCDGCRKFRHLGQRFAGTDHCVFGYGSNDAKGREDAGRFLLDHLCHNAIGLRVVETDDVPSDYKDDDPNHADEDDVNEKADQRKRPAGDGSREGQATPAETAVATAAAEVCQTAARGGDLYVTDPVTGVGYYLTFANDGSITRIRPDVAGNQGPAGRAGPPGGIPHAGR